MPSKELVAYKDIIRGWNLGRIKAELETALQQMCDASYRVDQTKFDDANWTHDALVAELIRRAAGMRADERFPARDVKLPGEWIDCEPEATMVKINGKTWRCSCGSNVQTKYAVSRDGTKEKYRCNGCGVHLEGER